MKINRTMSAAFLNEVANRPDIRPWLGGEGELDLTPIVENPDNYVLELEGKGGWTLQKVMDGTYELHTLFLPEARGRLYFVAAREALRWMFTRTDCLQIVTRCPDENGGARMAASLVGFHEWFRREDGWNGGGVSIQTLNVDDWCARDRAIVEEGRKFHEALEQAKQARGIYVPQHPQDDAHDRAVGAAAQMILGGQVAKGVNFYNRWATVAGYAPIYALGPNLVDIRDAIVEVNDVGMRVLLIRGAPPEE